MWCKGRQDAQQASQRRDREGIRDRLGAFRIERLETVMDGIHSACGEDSTGRGRDDLAVEEYRDGRQLGVHEDQFFAAFRIGDGPTTHHIRGGEGAGNSKDGKRFDIDIDAVERRGRLETAYEIDDAATTWNHDGNGFGDIMRDTAADRNDGVRRKR